MKLALLAVVILVVAVLVCAYYSKRPEMAETLVVGGLYASKNEDGLYVVSKVLAFDSTMIHVQIYRNKFQEIPLHVNPSILTLGKYGDAEGFGIAHAPMLRSGWLDTHIYLKRVPLRQEDMEGFVHYRQSMKR